MPFSEKLRNIFAAVGVCESTQEIARKPQVINELAAFSLAKADRQTQYPSTSSYETRLRAVLDYIPTNKLEMLLDNKIAISLDRRLAHAKVGFLDSSIHAVYYNEPGRKILSLYDNGKMPGDSAFLETDIIDNPPRAIKELLKTIDRDDNIPALLIGITQSEFNPATKVSNRHFRWQDQEHMERELRKNPALRTPPVRDDSHHPAPACTF